jgi:hypothetical protein
MPQFHGYSWRDDDPALFARTCSVAAPDGSVSALTVRFFGPLGNSREDEFLALARIACPFFGKDIFAVGSDAAQAFFALPHTVTSYLIGRRRFGYETYWFAPGDLDDDDFWTAGQFKRP